MIRTGRAGLGLVLLLGAACQRPAPPSAPAPENAELRLVDGTDLLAHIQGRDRVVVANFWATWCQPCKEEFPIFVKAAKKYHEHVDVFFVSMDFPEERASALDFLKAQGASLPSFAKKGKDHEFIDAIHPRWSGALPATTIYDREHQLRYFWEGKVDEGTLTQALEALLAPGRP